MKESAKSGKLSKVGNAYAKAKEKADSFIDDLVKGKIFISKANPYDLLATYSQTLSNRQLNKLIEDIKNNGIQETIKYVEYNGEKYVVYGHHRLLAAKRIGLTEVPIEMVQLPYGGYKTINDLLWYE